MKKSEILCLVCVVVLASCTQKADQVAETEKEVLAIHDEVMPKMETIVNLRKNLSGKVTQLDSLQQEGVSSTTLAQQRAKAFDLSSQLSTADSLMMEWMYQYRGDSAKALPPDEALAYFMKEKEKINRVKEETNKSIQEAKDFLK